eukprot:CAMPEP_0116835988 /NCGR_PEP_ID=MMETSP0418-20121206/7844_1 /TAXON_ID=1158023 /ORGANISM="Astrosyne radiata, Strain 13vi08-1A" /LENGTH=109 /DNA_ID=CAMNT_0004465703 /DNA_START=390 /DNA_END=716 /DNA_ORIENTATION=+
MEEALCRQVESGQVPTEFLSFEKENEEEKNKTRTGNHHVFDGDYDDYYDEDDDDDWESFNSKDSNEEEESEKEKGPQSMTDLIVHFFQEQSYKTSSPIEESAFESMYLD